LMANPLDALQDPTVKDQEASASNMLNGPASDQPVRVAGGPSVLCQRSWTGTSIKPARVAFPPSSSIHKEEEQASASLRLNGSGCDQTIRPPAPVSAPPPAAAAAAAAAAAPVLSNSSGMWTSNEPSRVALTPSASNAEVSSVSQHSVFKSNTFSSQRTQAADICHEVHAENMERRSKFNHRANRKKKKLSQTLIEVHVPPTSHAHKWSLEELLSVLLVFDGGNTKNPPLTPPVPKAGSIQTIEKDKPWQSLRVSAGDLFVADTKRADKGLVFRYPDGVEAFTRVPRKAALQMTRMGNPLVTEAYCKSLSHVERAQRKSLHRSKGKTIYSDSKMCNPGVQACRASTGVRESTYHSTGVPFKNWTNIVQTLCDVEKVMSSFVPTKELRRLNLARMLLKYKTMTANLNGDIVLEAKLFGSIAFALNVHLSCHTDVDFSRSVVSVYINGGGYGLSDRVVAYFCFPRLGIAVALRPGDILIFNPREYHAVSSHCNQDDGIYCVSMYLKTAVVSLNDNSIPLTAEQVLLHNTYKKRKRKK